MSTPRQRLSPSCIRVARTATSPFVAKLLLRYEELEQERVGIDNQVQEVYSGFFGSRLAASTTTVVAMSDQEPEQQLEEFSQRTTNNGQEPKGEETGASDESRDDGSDEQKIFIDVGLQETPLHRNGLAASVVKHSPPIQSVLFSPPRIRYDGAAPPAAMGNPEVSTQKYAVTRAKIQPMMERLESNTRRDDDERNGAAGALFYDPHMPINMPLRNTENNETQEAPEAAVGSSSSRVSSDSDDDNVSSSSASSQGNEAQKPPTGTSNSIDFFSRYLAKSSEEVEKQPTEAAGKEKENETVERACLPTPADAKDETETTNDEKTKVKECKPDGKEASCKSADAVPSTVSEPATTANLEKNQHQDVKKLPPPPPRKQPPPPMRSQEQQQAQQQRTTSSEETEETRKRSTPSCDDSNEKLVKDKQRRQQEPQNNDQGKLDAKYEAMAHKAVESGLWKRSIDKKTGKVYFFNRVEKKSCWNLAKELRKRDEANQSK